MVVSRPQVCSRLNCTPDVRAKTVLYSVKATDVNAKPRCRVHGTEMVLMAGLHRESGGFVDNYWACPENRCDKTSRARNWEEAERQSELQLMPAEEAAALFRATFKPVKETIPVDPGLGDVKPEDIEKHSESWSSV